MVSAHRTVQPPPSTKIPQLRDIKKANKVTKRNDTCMTNTHLPCVPLAQFFQHTAEPWLKLQYANISYWHGPDASAICMHMCYAKQIHNLLFQTTTTLDMDSGYLHCLCQRLISGPSPSICFTTRNTAVTSYFQIISLPPFSLDCLLIGEQLPPPRAPLADLPKLGSVLLLLASVLQEMLLLLP